MVVPLNIACGSTLLPSQLSGVKTGFYHTFSLTSPTLGRWTSLDPLSYAAGDVNLYRSLSNDPLNSLDPSGLDDVRPEPIEAPLPPPPSPPPPPPHVPPPPVPAATTDHHAEPLGTMSSQTGSGQKTSWRWTRSSATTAPAGSPKSVMALRGSVMLPQEE
jgi:RHS repeat-associated protein